MTRSVSQADIAHLYLRISAYTHIDMVGALSCKGQRAEGSGWRTDIHHEVILSSRSWELEAVHGRAAAIVDAGTHASRMSRGSQIVAGETKERRHGWFYVHSRDYSGSDPNTARPVGVCARNRSKTHQRSRPGTQANLVLLPRYLCLQRGTNHPWELHPLCGPRFIATWTH